jgi:hypothetical protein
MLRVSDALFPIARIALCHFVTDTPTTKGPWIVVTWYSSFTTKKEKAENVRAQPARIDRISQHTG